MVCSAFFHLQSGLSISSALDLGNLYSSIHAHTLHYYKTGQVRQSLSKEASLSCFNSCSNGPTQSKPFCLLNLWYRLAAISSVSKKRHGLNFVQGLWPALQVAWYAFLGSSGIARVKSAVDTLTLS